MAEKEYIERGAVLNKILYGNADSIVLRGYAVDMVKSVPAADVVEVVWCKDCKDFVPHGNGEAGTCRNPKCKGIRYATDFCSYGERKEKNG